MTTEQFSRTELLIGPEGLAKLRKASVLVVGLGAVGSYCVEALARAGVERLNLVDFDLIRPSNINRHIWAVHSTLNTPKAELARRRVLDINPRAQVEAQILFADQDTIPLILKPAPDLVLDAIDALNPKAHLLESCWRSGIPVISSMGAATRTNPFTLRQADLMDTTGCPLAKRIRKMLRNRGVGRGIRCVYSFQEQNTQALSASEERDMGEIERGRPRRRMGSLSTITGIFGLTLAHTALEHIVPGLSETPRRSNVPRDSIDQKNEL